MAQYSEINLDKACKKWAKAMVDDDVKTFKFDFSRVKFEGSRPSFSISVQAQSTPSTQVIFQDTFRNDTTLSQKHRIRCVRQTTSLATVHLQQAIVCDERTRLQLSEIPSHIASKSGFLNDLDVSNIKSHDFKEKLTWEVDDEIEVPPRSTVRADVIISEEEQQKNFVVQTRIRGNVHCDVTKSNGNVTSVDGDVKEILEQYAKREEKSLFDFTGSNEVIFISKGSCTFRYGISKKVNVYADES